MQFLFNLSVAAGEGYEYSQEDLGAFLEPADVEELLAHTSNPACLVRAEEIRAVRPRKQ